MRRIVGAILLCACAFPGGCGRALVYPLDTPTNVAGVYAALAPTGLAIHPLTRIEMDEKGQPRLACHLELTDRSGQGVRWLGRFHVEVLRATGLAPTQGTRELVYDMDLTSPDENAKGWDQITRTYVVLLGRLPDWAAQSETGEGKVGLRATFTFLGADGSDAVLETTFTLRR